jgi:hypothetical protein
MVKSAIAVLLIHVVKFPIKDFVEGSAFEH